MTAPNAVLSGTNVFKAGEFRSSAIRTLSAEFSGGGSAITTGTKLYIYVPVAVKILGWIVFCDVSATLAVDFWQVLLANAPPTISNSICNSNYPSITAGTQNSLLISQGGVLGFNTSLNVSGVPIIPAGSAVIANVQANNNAAYIYAALVTDCGS